MQQKVALVTLCILEVSDMTKKCTELDFDVIRDVGTLPIVYPERTIADGGWRIDVVGRNVLVSLQRTRLEADNVEFQSLLRKSGLAYLRVGAKTAKAMGITRWPNIQLIPETVYEAHIASVVANANADVLEGPFTAFLEEVKRDEEGPDGPQTC